MNLKQLIKEVERLNEELDNAKTVRHRERIGFGLLKIKQTVEAVDTWLKIKDISAFELGQQSMKDWQTLKKLLGLK